MAWSQGQSDVFLRTDRKYEYHGRDWQANKNVFSSAQEQRCSLSQRYGITIPFFSPLVHRETMQIGPENNWAGRSGPGADRYSAIRAAMETTPCALTAGTRRAIPFLLKVQPLQKTPLQGRTGRWAWVVGALS